MLKRFLLYGSILFIIFVLWIISLPNYPIKDDRPKSSRVKSNMHTIQTIAETYAVDWGGIYPENVSALIKEAKSGNYWKDFNNPCDKQTETSFSKLDLTHKDNLEKALKDIPKCAVIYIPVVNNNKSKTYYIYGVSDKNNELLKDKGSVFYLTNQ